MRGIRNRWLSPATLTALLLASLSFGCQIEYRYLDNDGRLVATTIGIASDAEQRPSDSPAAKPAGVVPTSAVHVDEAQPPRPITPPPADSGSGGPGTMNEPIPDWPIPTEKLPTAHPTYVIEPPDILMIQPVRLIPKPPYRVEPLDVLQIQVAETLPKEPINGPFVVSPDGMVNLGYGYSVVRIGGLTIEQAAQAIKVQLKLSIKEPQVSVSLLQFRGAQQIAGEHLVIQDGTVMLGSYGSVFVTGMTISQAKAAIERHLSQFLLNPEISLSVNAFNSKVYYVINDCAGCGMCVNRFPITGKETVLDAVSLNGGLAPEASRRRIWLARPGPPGASCYQILPVNWDAIVMGGDTTTNWQIFPGDRIFIDSEAFPCLHHAITKVFTPIEQLLGFTLRGATTTVEAVSGCLITNTCNR